MSTVSTPDFGALADSPYARELQRGVPNLRFVPKLEAEYQRKRLLQNRIVIRMACALAVALVALRILDKLVIQGSWNAWPLIDLSLVFTGSLLLAWIAWSRHYEHAYMSWARIVVPARNMIVATQLAAAAAHGQTEMLMLLPVMLLGPFFFLGLQFRAALFCCVVTVSAYALSANHFGLAPDVAARSYVLLLIGVVAYAVAARHLERSSRQSFLEGHLITELAQRDGLTGTRNRRAFDEHLGQLWQQAIDRKHAIAILLIDIDHFKAYNDCYGHQAGDHTLRRVAQAIQKFARQPPNILARYGGEEFALVLYDADTAKAKDVADQLRRAVNELNIEHRDSKTAQRVTISVGVAAVQATSERSPHGAVQLADQALYEAKVSGRNRVAVMDDEHHELLVTGVFAVDARSIANR